MSRLTGPVDQYISFRRMSGSCGRLKRFSRHPSDRTLSSREGHLYRRHIKPSPDSLRTSTSRTTSGPLRLTSRSPVAKAFRQTQSQEQKWTKTIRTRLDAWTADIVVPTSGTSTLRARAHRHSSDARSDGDNHVRTVVDRYGLRRSGGAPRIWCTVDRRALGAAGVICDAAALPARSGFPSATPAVMRPERTFWEKATAIHVFSRGGKLRGDDRFSRHWYDIVALDRRGPRGAPRSSIAASRDRVGRHKNVFFREKDGDSAYIDYAAAVRGQLQLAPEGIGWRHSPTTTRECSTIVSSSRHLPRLSHSSNTAEESKNAPTRIPPLTERIENDWRSLHWRPDYCAHRLPQALVLVWIDCGRRKSAFTLAPDFERPGLRRFS